MRPLARTAAALSALALTSVGCKSEPPPAAEPKVAPAPPTPPVAAAEPPPASISGKSQPDCIAPFSQEGAAKEITLGKRKAKVTGSVLEVLEPDADNAIVLGIVPNLKEGTGENLFNIKRYADFFAAEKVEAILVPGDSGKRKESIVTVLEPLAKTGLPVFVIPGNNESRADFTAAMDDLTARYPNVVSMAKVRLAKLDDASIVSLPGYYDRRFIHLGEAGCQYFKEDVEALSPIVNAAGPAPVVLLSHAEPHFSGHTTIDAFEHGNAGDQNLTEFLRKSGVPFGIFANIHEAGGRAHDLATNLIREGEAKEQLFLNPGLADSTPWKMNDNTWSYGMVATLTVTGKTAAYKVFRAPQLTEAEQAQARKLEPATAAVER